MAKPMDIIKKYWKLGAVLGALMPKVMELISKIPGIDVTQSTISVSVQDPNTGLASWVLNVFGANIGLPEILMGAIGGILFVALGAYLVEQFNIAKMVGAKTKVMKVATILFVAGIVSGWILQMALSIPGVGIIITNVVGSVTLGFILVKADDLLKTKLIPA